MRITRVTAESFGPLTDAALELAPGMTVVCGPNESGKSTWHAAVYAALCGLRRGRGKPRKAEQAFMDRHRPWDGQAWRVSATTELADGRVLEFRQDLAGKVDCRVRDVQLGRDVSDELMHDGSPDGAVLFGLTRDTLLPTVCVRQADVLGVLGDSEALQETLQRAAATGGADDTAQRALERLDAFRREHVGTDRRNSTKPLRRAVDAAQEARRRLEDARQAHAEYLELARRRDDARGAADQALAERDRARATLARRELHRVQQRLTEVSDLAARFPDGPPPDPDEDADVAERVRAALTAWSARPQEPAPASGPSAAELEHQLAALPEPPDGDVEAHPTVIDAHGAWSRAVARLEDYEDAAAPGAGATPGVDPALEHQTTRAGRPSRRVRLLAAAAVAVAAGAALLAAGSAALGGLLLVVGAGLGGAAWTAPPAHDTAASQARVAVPQATAQHVRQRRQERDEAAGRLRTALADRGAAAGDDLEAAVAEYHEACRERARQAREAQRAESLRAQLVDRRNWEEAVGRDRRRREEAERAVRDAARVAGLEGADDADAARLVERLESWQRRRGEQRAAVLAQWEEWNRLQSLLGGASVAEIRVEATRRRETADEYAGVEGLAVSEEGDAEAVLRRYEEAAGEARQQLAWLEGQLNDRTATTPNVAEAEEAYGRAEAELARLRRLDGTVETTEAFLAQARDGVHRDIAPGLKRSIERWLPQLTGERYDEAAVDPATLEVRVRSAGGPWRDAALLSQGTAEQIYLLLRVAMAEHLVTTAEPAPLLLDDPTVQTDHRRTQALLDLLHQLSRERQVVVFSQEDEVVSWARNHLAGPDDAVVDLDPRVIPA